MFQLQTSRETADTRTGLGAVPPFYSLVAPSCPMTTLPKQTERFCLNHTLAKSAGVNDGESSVCPGLVTPEYR